MKRRIRRLVPTPLRRWFRESQIYRQRSAIRLAQTSKRIDIVAARFANILHISKHPSLVGKTCLEIGSGRVLSHALMLHLLGAEKVIATDIDPIAQPSTLAHAVRSSIASVPRDVLGPHSNHSHVRARFDNLLGIERFDFDILRRLNIEYRCPLNLATVKLDTRVDFIYSNSVLEHVPVEDVPALLQNLVKCLNPSGTMIHCIHLEDHENIIGNPFAFLRISNEDYTPRVQVERGNRIRSSEWQGVFDAVEGASTDFIYRYSRDDRPLPSPLAPAFVGLEESDLRTSHIGAYTRKLG